jgi:nucleotide-binding universal stress UspA family protein
MTVKALDVVSSQDALVDGFRRKYQELHSASVRDCTIDRIEDARRLRLESVIVPLDGARYAEHALPLALELAAASKAPLVLESADCMLGRSFDPRTLSFEEISSPQRRDRIHAYLKNVGERISTEAVRVVPRLREVPTNASSLGETAGKSDLVVLGHRPCRCTDPFNLGHRVEKLLKFGSSPLLIVRGHGWSYTRREAERIKNILVILDGSAEAAQVLPAVFAIAEAVQAQLTLLRIVPGMPYYEIPWVVKEIEAKTYLDRIIQAIQPHHVAAHPAVWSSHESLGQVILSYAENHNADLIALTTSLCRTPLGSFRRQPVRYLARKSSIPLLIVSSDDAASYGNNRHGPTLRPEPLGPHAPTPLEYACC